MHECSKTLLFRFVHESAVDIRRHVVRGPVNVVLDHIDLQVREAINTFPGLFGRLADCIQAAGIKPRPVKRDMGLFVP